MRIYCMGLDRNYIPLFSTKNSRLKPLFVMDIPALCYQNRLKLCNFNQQTQRLDYQSHDKFQHQTSSKASAAAEAKEGTTGSGSRSSGTSPSHSHHQGHYCYLAAFTTPFLPSTPMKLPSQVMSTASSNGKLDWKSSQGDPCC